MNVNQIGIMKLYCGSPVILMYHSDGKTQKLEIVLHILQKSFFSYKNDVVINFDRFSPDTIQVT